jgi:hypothetical protein
MGHALVLRGQVREMLNDRPRVYGEGCELGGVVLAKCMRIHGGLRVAVAVVYSLVMMLRVYRATELLLLRVGGHLTICQHQGRRLLRGRYLSRIQGPKLCKCDRNGIHKYNI